MGDRGDKEQGSWEDGDGDLGTGGCIAGIILWEVQKNTQKVQNLFLPNYSRDLPFSVTPCLVLRYDAFWYNLACLETCQYSNRHPQCPKTCGLPCESRNHPGLRLATGDTPWRQLHNGAEDNGDVALRYCVIERENVITEHQ